MPPTKPLRVAVVGAGPSGLSACRHLASKPDRFEFICYEQCPSVGGAWYYSEDNVDYDHISETELERRDASLNPSAAAQFQSPMYKNLRTNSPREVFVFPDFPFGDEHFSHESSGNEQQLRSFITHAEMLGYFRSYAEHFNLMPHIRLNTSVVKVRRVESSSENSKLQYRVSSIDTQSGTACADEIFGAVMVCIGRYIKPKWPTIKNLDIFQGKLVHSKYYRHPKQFPASRNKIIVMGGGYSGIDVAIDLDRNSATKKQIILSAHNQSNVGNLDNWYKDSDIQLKSDIVEVVGPNEVKFADGAIETHVDAILMGTGYYYDFPFLSKEDGLALTVDDARLTPLYKHMVHINYPTLCFIGMIWTGLTVPQFDQQVKYFIAMLNGDFKLPSRAEMLQWAAEDMKKRTSEYKWPKRYAHKMGRNVQREYMASLCKESGISPLDPAIFAIDDEVADLRSNDPVKFKLQNYKWNESDGSAGKGLELNGHVSTSEDAR